MKGKRSESSKSSQTISELLTEALQSCNQKNALPKESKKIQVEIIR